MDCRVDVNLGTGDAEEWPDFRNLSLIKAALLGLAAWHEWNANFPNLFS